MKEDFTKYMIVCKYNLKAIKFQKLRPNGTIKQYSKYFNIIEILHVHLYMNINIFSSAAFQLTIWPRNDRIKSKLIW